MGTCRGSIPELYGLGAVLWEELASVAVMLPFRTMLVLPNWLLVIAKLSGEAKITG